TAPGGVTWRAAATSAQGVAPRAEWRRSGCRAPQLDTLSGISAAHRLLREDACGASWRRDRSTLQKYRRGAVFPRLAAPLPAHGEPAPARRAIPRSAQL